MILPTRHGSHLFRRPAGVPKAAQSFSLVAFGETFAVGTGEQAVMMIVGNVQIQQRLQQSVDVRGLKKVLTASHICDTLDVIIDGDGQMIAGRRILAGQDNVAETLGLRVLAAFVFIGPGQRSRPADRRIGFQSHGMGLAGGDPVRRLGGRQFSANAGIEGAVRTHERTMRGMAGGGDFRLYVLAGAKTGIGQALLAKNIQSRGVIIHMRRLAAHGLFPGQPQPFHVLEDGGVEFNPAAAPVDILNTQQKPPAMRMSGSKQRRVGMAKMQVSCRAGRKAGNDIHKDTLARPKGGGNSGAIAATNNYQIFPGGDMNDTPDLFGPIQEPASGMSAEQLVILCHGVGSDGNDLIGLAPYFAKVLPDAKFLAPNAPQPFDMAPMGYQWFPLQDLSQEARLSGTQASAPILNAFIDRQLEDHGLTEAELALVGFSQGTMMSLHVGLRRARPLAAIVGYSGMLTGPHLLASEIQSRPPVLLMHGDADDVVPPESLPEAVAALQAAGVNVRHETRPGLGHGLDDQCIMRGMDFLAESFGIPLPTPA